ncbi:MAG: hypothetical protein L0229_15530 [Blastocatellia bacterium]|nr:hypothetical protein [Blastocatellia bacterium]
MVTLTGTGLKTASKVIIPDDAKDILSVKDGPTHDGDKIIPVIEVKKTAPKTFKLEIDNFRKRGSFNFEVKEQ